MLIVETIARIRREHFIKGKTIKEIARDLKVSRNTVRKVLRSGETSFEYERAVQPRPPWQPAVLRRLRPWQACHRWRCCLSQGSLIFRTWHRPPWHHSAAADRP